MNEKYDIFLSYSHEDGNIANELYSKLTKAGLRCFMAEKDIAPAEQWENKIRDAIHLAKQILLLITPRSQNSHWVLVESGAAWALKKDLIPVLMFVKPHELIDPVRRYQAHMIETPSEIESLVSSLSDRGSVVQSKICGQWIDPADNDTVFFKQVGDRVVGLYDFDGRKNKVGVYVGTFKDRVLEYRWKWLGGKFEGHGHMMLSNDDERLAGDWWYSKNQERVEHVGYRRVSDDMPSWLVEADFEEYDGFLNE